MFSEIVTDLANEIAQCRAWRDSELRSPAQPKTPEPKQVKGPVEVATACRMAVEIPLPEKGPVGRVDGFIDDLINGFLTRRKIVRCNLTLHHWPFT